MTRASLVGNSRSLARHLRDLLYGPPKRKPNPEQMASLQLYSTEDRRVRAVPTRRNVNRKGADAA